MLVENAQPAAMHLLARAGEMIAAEVAHVGKSLGHPGTGTGPTEPEPKIVVLGECQGLVKAREAMERITPDQDRGSDDGVAMTHETDAPTRSGSWGRSMATRPT